MGLQTSELIIPLNIMTRIKWLVEKIKVEDASFLHFILKTKLCYFCEVTHEMNNWEKSQTTETAAS